jgi:hypothetical protein
MKVLIGCLEICGLINVLKDGIIKNNYTTTTVNSSQNKFYNFKYDFNPYELSYHLSIFKFTRKRTIHRIVNTIINRIPFVKKKLVEKLFIKKNDIFIFIWGGETLLPDNKDLELIKKHNKKIIQLFLGDDVRHPASFTKEFGYFLPPPYNYEKNVTNLKSLLSRIEKFEKFADIIYTAPGAASLLLRPYHHIHIPIELTRYSYIKKGNGSLNIVHIPSNSEIKGTSIIINVVQQLSKENFKFNFQLIENVPNEKIPDILSNADILIDELYLNGPGVLSIEAMASGCVVLTKHLDNYRDKWAPPIISVNKDNLYCKLKDIIRDDKKRNSIRADARKFVLKHNSHIKVSKMMLSNITENNTDPDYTPSFRIKNQSFLMELGI